jgi:hypothetical protein
MPGTPLSTNRGRSCPLRNATGRTSVIHCEDWYKAGDRVAMPNFWFYTQRLLLVQYPKFEER